MLRPSRHLARGLLVVLLAVGSLLLGRSGVRADLPPGITLTSADDGTTITGTVGETVLLKLDTAYSWNVSIDNSAMLFRPPVALSVGLQGDWEIVAPGQVTISASGDPLCRQATPACAAPSRSWSATVSVAGTLRSVTPSANGTTIAANVGDYIRLDAAPLRAQNVQSSNPAVLAPVQISFYGGVLLEALAPGRATLTATLNPACYPQCLIASTAFSATITVSATATPDGEGTSVRYAAGWNLVGVPDGTALPVDAFLWQPQQGGYTTVPAGQPLQGGNSYWAEFPSATGLSISGNGSTTTIAAPAGGWVMIGDPSATLPGAVSGADMLFTWDPAAGAYTPASVLQPGQGGLALRGTAGPIVITPIQ